MSDLREYVGVIRHKDYVANREGFERVIKFDAEKEMNALGYVVRDFITEWIKKPSFIDGEIEWACRVVCIVADQLEETING